MDIPTPAPKKDHLPTETVNPKDGGKSFVESIF